MPRFLNARATAGPAAKGTCRPGSKTHGVGTTSAGYNAELQWVALSAISMVKGDEVRQSYSGITGIIFAVVTVGHAIRLVLDWPV